MRDNKGDNMTIDYKEIRLWIENDEGLYNWWKDSRQPISTFIKENRSELVSCIRQALS